jgi:hypothetical protein
LDELDVRDGELIALRLYTGPCYILYNTALRGMGNGGRVPAYDPQFADLDVRGCFVSTLHAINHGCLKLARLSPNISVFRGLAGMKLPEAFLQADDNGFMGGVEYGFMSTTSDEAVALGYA